MRLTDVKPEPLQHQSCNGEAGLEHGWKQITAEVVLGLGRNHGEGFRFDDVHTRVDEATEGLLRRGFFGEPANETLAKIAVHFGAVRSTKPDDAKGTRVLHFNEANRQRCARVLVMGEKGFQVEGADAVP